MLSDDCHLSNTICQSLSLTCSMLLAFLHFLCETYFYLQNLFPFARCCTSRNFFSNSAHLDKLNSTILAIYTTLAININHDSQRRKCYQKQITRNCVTVTNQSFQNIVTKHYSVFCIQIEIEFGGNGQIFSQVSL